MAAGWSSVDSTRPLLVSVVCGSDQNRPDVEAGTCESQKPEKIVSKRRGGAQVRMSAVRKAALPAVACWRASAIISGVASIAVTMAAEPARCRVRIRVPQAIFQQLTAQLQVRNPGSGPSVGAVHDPVRGRVVLGGVPQGWSQLWQTAWSTACGPDHDLLPRMAAQGTALVPADTPWAGQMEEIRALRPARQWLLGGTPVSAHS